MKKNVLSIVLSLAFAANVYSQYKIEEVLNFEQDKWQELKHDTLYVVLEDDTASNYNKEINLAVKENWKFSPFKFVYRNNPLAYEANKFYLSYNIITQSKFRVTEHSNVSGNYPFTYDALIINKGPYWNEDNSLYRKLPNVENGELIVNRDVMSLTILNYNSSYKNTNDFSYFDLYKLEERLCNEVRILKSIEKGEIKIKKDVSSYKDSQRKLDSLKRENVYNIDFEDKNLIYLAPFISNFNTIGENILNGSIKTHNDYNKYINSNLKTHVNKELILLNTDISKQIEKKIIKSTLKYKVVTKEERIKAIRNKEDVNIVFWHGHRKYNHPYWIFILNCKTGDIFYQNENLFSGKTNGGLTRADLSSLTVQQQMLKAGN